MAGFRVKPRYRCKDDIGDIASSAVKRQTNCAAGKQFRAGSQDSFQGYFPWLCKAERQVATVVMALNMKVETRNRSADAAPKIDPCILPSLEPKCRQEVETSSSHVWRVSRFCSIQLPLLQAASSYSCLHQVATRSTCCCPDVLSRILPTQFTSVSAPPNAKH